LLFHHSKDKIKLLASFNYRFCIRNKTPLKHCFVKEEANVIHEIENQIPQYIYLIQGENFPFTNFLAAVSILFPLVCPRNKRAARTMQLWPRQSSLLLCVPGYQLLFVVKQGSRETTKRSVLF